MKSDVKRVDPYDPRFYTTHEQMREILGVDKLEKRVTALEKALLPQSHQSVQPVDQGNG